LEFLRGPKTPNERWVWVQLPDGNLRKLPRDWTALGYPDPYQVLPKPPLLRLEALVELAKWVALRKKGRRKRTKKLAKK
jgi:hypothetical protein